MTKRSLSFALLLASIFVFPACEQKKEESAPRPQAKSPVVKIPQEDSGWVPRVLGRAPSFSLTDQDGERFSSDRLEGKPWVANFMFTRCPTICPQQTALLRSVQSKLEEVGTLNIISFTVDPTNDTPDVLKAYAVASGANQDHWRFLTGSIEELHSAVSKGGFKLAVEPDPDIPGGFIHSPMLVLVDAYNRIRGLYDSGSATALDELFDGLQSLEDEIVRVPADNKNPAWLEPRRQAQLAAAESIGAFHDFKFSDARFASGIRFRNRIVDDAGRTFKAVHYDHGTGLAVADVDGDDLLDIYFVTQMGANALWKNLGGGKFEDITGANGIALDDRVGVSASFADIDNDGDPDLYATSVRAGNKLFENDGKGEFKDITESSGLGHSGHSSGALFFDYDRDGLLDVLVTNVGKYTFPDQAKVPAESIRGKAPGTDSFPIGVSDGFAGHLKADRTEMSRLFRNQGDNRFTDVTEQVGLINQGWTGDAAAVDLNSDGWPDLYLPSMQGDDEIFLNRGGEKFENVSRQLFPNTPWGSMGIKAFDFENDGDLDLYLTDMHSDMSIEVGPEKEKAKAEMQWPASFLTDGKNSIFGNAFFLNGGADDFTEISDQIGAENYWPWGLSVDDLNADGFDDVFITASMNFPYRYSLNSVLLNDGGKKFRDSEFILGVEPRADGLAAPWFEFETTNSVKHKLIYNTVKNQVADVAKLPEKIVIWSAKGTRSSAIFDLDNDGDLDIVTNEMNHYPMILVSNLVEQKPDLAYLKITLSGTKSNRSGLGAVVRVEAGEQKLMKVNDGQSGYLSHSEIPLYFGLGSATQVDKIEVTWPSGKLQVINGPVEKNQTLKIIEEL